MYNQQGDNLQEVLCCFNPYCIDPNSRVFPTNHPHQGLIDCQKWIISQKDLTQIGSAQSSFPTFCNMPIDFESQPIKCLKMVKMLQNSDWKDCLQEQQTQFKKRVIDFIEDHFDIIRNKINDIVKKADIFDHIKSIDLDSQNGKELLNLYPIHRFFSPKQLDTCFQIKNDCLQKHLSILQGHIKQLSSSFFSEKIKLKSLNVNQKERLYEYVTEYKKENPFQKIQEINSALKKSAILYKKQNDNLFLECPVCSMIGPKIVSKQTENKKFLAEYLLDHLYQTHYDKLSEVHKFKISKSHIKCVTIEQSLKQAKHYKNVLIIDRASGVEFEQNFEIYKQDIYPIQVLSKKTCHMAKGRHILIKQHDAIDTIIIQVAKICLLRGQNVQVESAKKSFINCLEQIPGIQLQKNMPKFIKA